jgi:hypothetical protein
MKPTAGKEVYQFFMWFDSAARIIYAGSHSAITDAYEVSCRHSLSRCCSVFCKV